jgi:hypothetical protein
VCKPLPHYAVKPNQKFVSLDGNVWILNDVSSVHFLVFSQIFSLYIHIYVYIYIPLGM